MDYLTQKELREMMLLSYERIEQEKEEINKINVFPVPDQDTGNNMAKTLLGVKEAIEGKEFKNLEELSEAILDGALTSAQGNAGVIYTGFLAGFLLQLDKNPVNIQKLALAFEKGAERARTSIQNPQEGTILDVIDASALALTEQAKGKSDIVNAFKKAAEQASKALLETREKMEIFKKANVVDAGGLGFLVIVESFLGALEKISPKLVEKREEKPSQQIKRFVQVITNRYEVVSLIENSNFNEKEVQEKLKRLGDCLDIVKVKNKMKIHIHTDYPDEVREVMNSLGQVQNLRVEDMSNEVVGEESVRKVSIGIVTEDIAALLPKIAERYQIELALAQYNWPPEKDLPDENLYQKMREADKKGIKVFPKTSQPSPSSYLEAFKKQLEKFGKILCITPSSKLSGCYNSAKQAEGMLQEPERVFVLDSLNAVAGQTLLLLKAIELIQEQKTITEVINELKKEIPKIHLYLIFEDPKWTEALGKITKNQADWIRRMKKINIHPIMKVKDGITVKGGIVFAKDMAEAFYKKILKESKEVRRDGKTIRVIINHADNPEVAQNLKKMLKEKIKVEIPFINLGPSIFAALVPGTVFVGWTAI